MKTSATFAYTFPAIRGVQAGREYYVSMCPLKIIPKLFHFDNGNLGPELRAQRILNKNRIPALTNYIIEIWNTEACALNINSWKQRISKATQ